MSHNVAGFWSRAGAVAKHALYLGFSFFGVMNLAPIVAVPPSNPLHISNAYSDRFFNPSTNVTQLILVIAGTVGLYYLLQYLDRTERGWWFKAIVVAYVFGNWFLVHQLPAYVAQGGLDVFHSGEQLSPTEAFIQGKHLFSQIFMFHGAGDDVITTAVSFKLWGHTIGSYILFGFVEQFLAATAFFILLGRLVRSRVAFMILALITYASLVINIWYVRDVAVWMSLLLVYELLVRSWSRRRQMVVMAVLGILAAGSCFFSVDRGLLLLGLDGLVGLGWLFMRVSPAGAVRLDAAGWRQRWTVVAWLPVGMVAITIPIALWLGQSSMEQFVHMTFIDLPKIKGLISEYPFPTLQHVSQLVLWLPVMVMILVSVLLVELIWRQRRMLSVDVVYAGLLVIFGLVFFRTGLGRSDIGHIAYASTPLWLALIVTVKVAWKTRLSWWPSAAGLGLGVPVAAAVALAVWSGSLSWEQLATIPEWRRDEVGVFLQMRRFSDDYWLPADMKAAKDYILANSRPDDGLFAFTSNPMYYYLTQRPNPSRFYISWFADPQPYTDELLRDLKARPPKYVVYADGQHDAPDFVPMTQRIPEVNAWIIDHYRPAQTFGKTQLYEYAASNSSE